MATFQNTVTIARPADEVFAFLADFGNIPAWNYAIGHTVQTSPGQAGVGATYRQTRLAHLLLLPFADMTDGPGGHRYFEPSTPFLSLSLPTAPGPRRPNESHATSAGSRCESDEPGT
jgi:hypothetical protein